MINYNGHGGVGCKDPTLDPGHFKKHKTTPHSSSGGEKKEKFAIYSISKCQEGPQTYKDADHHSAKMNR